MAGSRTLKYKESAVKKPIVSRSTEPMVIPPPEKKVIASMSVEISIKKLKKRLPKPVLPEPKAEL